MKDHRTRWLVCPHCGQLLDGALNTTGHQAPRDWDPTVCVYCGRLAVFEFSIVGGLRTPNEDDWEAWREDPGMVRALSRVLAAIDQIRLTRKDPDV